MVELNFSPKKKSSVSQLQALLMYYLVTQSLGEGKPISRLYGIMN